MIGWSKGVYNRILGVRALFSLKVDFTWQVKGDTVIPPPPILYLHVLYGLPKILKANVPLRSILSAIGTCGYKLAKFLVPCLDQITSNNFTVKYSVSSANEIRDLRNGDDTNQFVMASFDVKSLFTNIPLNETIHMGANELYDINNTPFFIFQQKSIPPAPQTCCHRNLFHV